jgi:hypothetical protein
MQVFFGVSYAANLAAEKIKYTRLKMKMEESFTG